MPFLPTEFTYEAQDQPEPVVVSRQENYIIASGGDASQYSSGGTNVIRFNITGPQMLDLSSVKMYARVQYQSGHVNIQGLNATYDGGANGINANPAAEDKTKSCIVNPSISYFSSMEISTLGGVIIERIEDAVLLGQIVTRMSVAKDWQDTTGAFMGEASDPALRRAHFVSVYGQNRGHVLEIHALKLFGFLQSGKYINPNSMGGLSFSFTLAPSAEQVFAAATITADLNLSDCRLYYDMCKFLCGPLLYVYFSPFFYRYHEPAV